MEGPTPVSALIHAATMVTAGVYMIGRTAVLFAHVPQTTLQIVAVIGAATALLAGTIGLVQNDIKRVLAYSTVSQLGYMFLAMGVGAFGAGIFHLYTHAFFKALLFLGSGAVIHALHGEQDIRNMGGLKKALPITYWTFLIGSLAIAGVPPLAGFFSKDEILFETFRHGHQVLWTVGILTSLLTATYMFRLVFLTFHGEQRFALQGAHGAHRADVVHAVHPVTLHDAPPAMAFVLIVLAIGSVGAGWLGIPHALGGHNLLGTFLEPNFAAANCAPEGALASTGPLAGIALEDCAPGDVALASQTQPLGAGLPSGGTSQTGLAQAAGAEADDETALERVLMGASTLVALAGIGLAAFIYLRRPETADLLAARFAPLYRVLSHKYYVDELYDATIVQPIKVGSREVLWKGVDVRIIDGAVNGTGQIVAVLSGGLRLLQNGSVKAYAASTIAGVVLILAYYVWR
jgi:NADH-quinone oxidoreductase subunit L